jgi:hypothetical protein
MRPSYAAAILIAGRQLSKPAVEWLLFDAPGFFLIAANIASTEAGTTTLKSS